jgi:valyl-tRNA synthetase
MKMAGNRLESSRNFVNKIWNASRFVIQNIEPDKTVAPVSSPTKFAAVEDRWILSRLNRTLINTTQLMEDFQFGEAQRQIYDFLWSEFCDWYIEIAKIRLRYEKTVSPVPLLVYILETSLRLLHPFMPFITEELWQTLKQRLPENSDQPESIMISAYPEGEEKFFDPEAERIIESLIEIVHSIRNTRAEHKVESNKLIEAHIYAGDLVSSLKPYYQTIQTLAQVQPLELLDIRHRGESDDKELVLILKDTEVVIPLASMVDLEAEKSRLRKELAEVKINVGRLESRLNDEAFINKAPANVVQKERDRFNEGRDKLQRLQQQLERFK